MTGTHPTDTGPRTFRTKHAEIEALQFLGSAQSATPIIEWILESGGTASFHEHLMDGDLIGHPDPFLRIDLPEGRRMVASIGDWIMREAGGQFRACKSDAFAATYEPVPAVVQPEATPDTEGKVDRAEVERLSFVAAKKAWEVQAERAASDADPERGTYIPDEWDDLPESYRTHLAREQRPIVRAVLAARRSAGEA